MWGSSRSNFSYPPVPGIRRCGLGSGATAGTEAKAPKTGEENNDRLPYPYSALPPSTGTPGSISKARLIDRNRFCRPFLDLLNIIPSSPVSMSAEELHYLEEIRAGRKNKISLSAWLRSRLYPGRTERLPTHFAAG